MNADSHDEARVRVLAAGMSAADVEWIDGLGWNDASVPPVRSAAQLADYKRREQILNAAVAHLSFAERGDSPEGRLAAAIGAEVANWSDRAEEAE